jgi:predicted  nucleic acid-binding Zn-ribbon protein
MKYLIKFFKILFIIIVISAAGIIFTKKTDISMVREYYREIRPCSIPLKYSVGAIDPRFNISQEDFVTLSKQAEGIWEEGVGKDLLEYDQQAKLKINLVYDERQILTEEAEKISDNINELEISHEALTKQYGNIQNDYSQKVKSYEKALADYQERLEEYNDEVQSWNEKGGVPEDEYQNLLDEKKKLKEIYETLEKKRKEINKLAGKTNDLVAEEKKILNQYNANVSTYKKLFGGTREFEKGVFSGDQINIYQFKEKSDLRLTMIHELGHALDFGHVENPESIMYYLIGEQDLNNPTLTQEDLAEVKRICN